jgi:hypothetical protein
MSNAIKGIVDTTETLRGNLNAEGTLSGNLNAARGFDGESAYDVAVKNGFEGTEQEWLTSLKGEKGEQGEQGIGIQGEKGEKGDTGNSGVYLGSGDMPDDCNVQIDPDGDVVTVEQLIEEITTKSATKTADGTVVSQNADFAEVAEWADGNPNNEDRTGYFVCANVPVNGIVMKKATSKDDVKGVTIFAPAFAGNYTKDKIDSNGNLLPKYSYVAIIGFVPVIDNGTCTVGGRCMPDDNGCAIPSSNSMGYQVVNRIDENRVLIIIEPNGDMVQRVKTKINQLQDDVNNRVANALKGSASGSSVTIKDISPVEHNVGCKVRSKNLLDAMAIASQNNNTDYVKDEANNSFTMRGNEGNAQHLAAAGQLMLPYTNTANISTKGIKVKAGLTYVVSFDYTLLEQGKYNNQISVMVYKENLGSLPPYGSPVSGVLGETVRRSVYCKPTTDGTIGLCFRINNNYVTISNIQVEEVEVGTTATEYTPYIEDLSAVAVKVQETGETFRANSDGTVEGIKSLYPTTTLMTDTEGVTISAEYNRDINKAFAALEAAIANL